MNDEDLDEASERAWDQFSGLAVEGVIARAEAESLRKERDAARAEAERLRAVVPKMAQLLRDYLESCAFLHQAEGEIGYGPCSCETCAGAREILREIEGG